LAAGIIFVFCNCQALEIFTSMCMFEEAKQLAEQVAAGQLLKSAVGRGAAAVAELMGRQAAWSEETANYEAAAEMYIKVRLGQQLYISAKTATCSLYSTARVSNA
jgi:hypothetical protein